MTTIHNHLWRALSAFTLMLGVSACSSTPPIAPTDLPVTEALDELMKGLVAAQERQRKEGKLLGLALSEASVTLNVTVKDVDKKSLVLGIGAAPGRFNFGFTPFDRTHESSQANTITVKFSNLMTTSLKDTMLSALAEAAKPRPGETDEQALLRLRKILTELQNSGAGIYMLPAAK
jgi:hypothetical protein